MQSITKWALIALSPLDFSGEPVKAEADVVKGTLILAEAIEQACCLVALLPLGNNGVRQFKKLGHGILLVFEEQE
jgi:hypothetical protein